MSDTMLRYKWELDDDTKDPRGYVKHFGDRVNLDDTVSAPTL